MPVAIGRGGFRTLSNSQCAVGASSVAASGNTLTLSLSLNFQPSFAGAKDIFMEAFDGSDSGWQPKGTWTVTAH
jgi:hypothetical protein